MKNQKCEHCQLFLLGKCKKPEQLDCSMKNTKSGLTLIFRNRSDIFWDIHIVTDEDHENCEFENFDVCASVFVDSGFSGVSCTGFANQVSKLLGTTEIFGFYVDDSLDALICTIASGHDFAVFNSRFIVDPWLCEVESGRITSHTGKTLDLNGQIVFDMVEDKELIETLYGSSTNWSAMEAVI